MSNDFTDAAFRHYESATMLSKQGQLANASHLFGLVAECVLKALIFQQRINVPVPKAAKKHINEGLWLHFYSHPATASFPIRMAKAQGHEYTFEHWRPAQRYWSRVQFATQAGNTALQAQGAKGLLGILDLAQRGLL